MRCPICDAKLESGQICKYCKVTREEIENASNKKVKEYKKTDRSDLIYFTNVIPKDVSRLKLIILTIVLGLFGANHFYVKRTKRGLFSLITFINCLLFLPIQLTLNFRKIIVLELIYELIYFSMAIVVILWVFDIVAVLIRTFKVPVVLGKKENK